MSIFIFVGNMWCVLYYSPHSTSPSMSVTLLFHYHSNQIISSVSQPGQKASHTRPPSSSSQSFILTTLFANESASFSVSPGATAANTSTPRPMDDTRCFSTVTDAESTR